MEDISLKNNKAEIFTAYQALQSALAETERQFEELKTSINEIPEETKETLFTPERVTVCIPYVKSLAQGNELQLALRGWAEYFKEDMNVVVIGDREDWMSDLVHVIECERFSTNPPLDVVHKMMLAIESDLVSEKFIWANDDQYLISPCMLADFETLKCTGRLGDKGTGSSLYQQNKKRTFDELLKNNQSTWDFSTHIPFVFEKERLLRMIEGLNLTEVPHLVATLYFNAYFPGFVPYECEGPAALENDNLKVGVYRPNADLDRLKNLIQRKKLISNSESGWTEKLSEILNSYFSFQCRFEN